MDAIVVEKASGLPRVFGGDQLDLLEDANGPQSDVLEVADGGGHNVERRHDPVLPIGL
jgi:hypothetical protein